MTATHCGHHAEDRYHRITGFVVNLKKNMQLRVFHYEYNYTCLIDNINMLHNSINLRHLNNGQGGVG